MDPHRVVGLPEERAEKLAAEAGLTTRVTMRDFEYFVVTRDYDENRLNLQIIDGVVVTALIG